MIKKDEDFVRRLPTTSMLRGYPVFYDTKDGVRFLNVFRSIQSELKLVNTFIYSDYIVQEDDWFDLIAYRAYENVNLWWMIPMVNDKVNPFEEIDTGETIKVLSQRYMFVIYDDLNEIGEL